MDQQSEDKWAIKALPNPDKTDHESEPGVDPLDICHPFRLLLAGKPNSGKTSVALACVARQNPPFERIVVWHCDGMAEEYTKMGIRAEVVTEMARSAEESEIHQKTVDYLLVVLTKGLLRDDGFAEVLLAFLEEDLPGRTAPEWS